MSAIGWETVGVCVGYAESSGVRIRARRGTGEGAAEEGGATAIAGTRTVAEMKETGRELFNAPG